MDDREVSSPRMSRLSPQTTGMPGHGPWRVASALVQMGRVLPGLRRWGGVGPILRESAEPSTQVYAHLPGHDQDYPGMIVFVLARSSWRRACRKTKSKIYPNKVTWQGDPGKRSDTGPTLTNKGTFSATTSSQKPGIVPKS